MAHSLVTVCALVRIWPVVVLAALSILAAYIFDVRGCQVAMRGRFRALNDEMCLMAHALVESWPALILAAIFILAAMVIDSSALRP